MDKWKISDICNDRLVSTTHEEISLTQEVSWDCTSWPAYYFATMTFTLGAISEDISNHEPLTVAERGVQQLAAFAHDALLTSSMFVVTSLGIFAVRELYCSCLRTLFDSRGGSSTGSRHLCLRFTGNAAQQDPQYVFQRPRPHFDESAFCRLAVIAFPADTR